MVVMGIDPGFGVTGFGIIKKEGNKAFLLDYGFLKLSSEKSLSERIGIFYKFILEKVEQFSVDVISIETPFLGKNAQNFLKLGYLRGILYLVVDIKKLYLVEFSPSEIKLSLTGSGYADKDQVSFVVLKLFPGLSKPKKLDVTDALAVAVCGLWKQQSLYHSNYSRIN